MSFCVLCYDLLCVSLTMTFYFQSICSLPPAVWPFPGPWTVSTASLETELLPSAWCHCMFFAVVSVTFHLSRVLLSSVILKFFLAVKIFGVVFIFAIFRWSMQGSKKIFCSSCKFFFGPDLGANFSGRIFSHLGRKLAKT